MIRQYKVFCFPIQGRSAMSATCLAASVFLSSCAHRAKPQRNDVQITTKVSTNSEIASVENNSDIEQLEKEMEGLPAASDEKEASIPETGIVTAKSLKHPSVQGWIKYFAKGEKSRFQRHLDRAEPYRKVVQEILVAQGVPSDIFYLGIIESGYRSAAKSTANAVGIWQFIAPTGTRYGLEVNQWVDERRDVIRATEAAAKYLKDLHNVFNSWELALAAYNTGEGRVLRAILRAKSRDFWELLDKNVLPTETQDYVPKFVAAAYIYENAKKFGFELPEDEDHPRLAVIDLPPRVRLYDIARVSGIDYDKLTFYNPHLLRGQTPPTRRGYKIWVPRQSQQKVLVALASLPRGAQSLASAQPLGFAPQLAGAAPNNRQISSKVVKSRFIKTSRPSKVATVKTFDRPQVKRVYVKRGQNLEQLSRDFGVSVEEIKNFNALSGARVMAGQELKIPVRSASSFRPSTQLPTKTLAQQRVLKYKVRKGDSLTSIADQFGVSVEKLQKDNRLRRQTVFAGEVIKVDSRGI